MKKLVALILAVIVVSKTSYAANIDISPNEQATWVSTDIPFTVTVTDTPSGVLSAQIRYSVNDGATWTGWYGITTPTYNGNLSPSDGKRKTEVKVVENDATETTKVSGTYLIDKTAPSTSVILDKSVNGIVINAFSTDPLSGIKSYKYTVTENLGPVVHSSEGLSPTLILTSLLSNRRYEAKTEVFDNVDNKFTDVSNISTLAVNSEVRVIAIEDNKLVFEVNHSSLNANVPEVKIIATNVNNLLEVIESPFTSSNTVVLSGVSKYDFYKIEYVTRNIDGVENEKIVLSEKLSVIGDSIPPEIQSLEINYGDLSTTNRFADIKIIATDDSTHSDKLKVSFLLGGERYGYNKTTSAWVKNYYGDYMKYYPSFDLGEVYGVKSIYASVKDEAENVATKYSEIFYGSEEMVVPEISEVPRESNDFEFEEKTNNGHILIKNRLVKIKLESADAKYAQYSLDSITWSPWEEVENGYIDKYVTLKDDIGALKTVYTRTKNEYGNISQIKINYYYLDNEAPKLDIQPTNNVNIAVDGNISFRVNISDNVTENIKYKLSLFKNGIEESAQEGVAVSNTAIIKHVTGLSTGFYNVRLWAEDNLENTSYSSFVIWSK